MNIKIVSHFSSTLSRLLFLHVEAPVWVESEWGRLEKVFARAQRNVTHFKAEKISFHFLLSQHQRLESMESNTFLLSHQSHLQHLKPPDGRFNALVRCSNMEVSQIQEFYSCPKYIYIIEAIQIYLALNAMQKVWMRKKDAVLSFTVLGIYEAAQNTFTNICNDLQWGILPHGLFKGYYGLNVREWL